MKRILINATHAEEIRVALCNGNHLYDFDLENRTREQKKANIYKGRVTRVEPSLEAVFVEYGSMRQGFLPIREIASEYLAGDARSTNNIKQLIKEGDELIVQVEKEERGNKGAALSTFISLAGRYLVLMPNNPRGGGISRQISGKVREEMKQALADLNLPKGMSVIIRTAGIGKTTEDLQHDLDHLLSIWKGIQQQNQKYPAPRLVHQEAGVVTRAVRDYLRDDIAEIWVDNENAYNEAANFIEAVMPQQLAKLRKYADYEPMFARFGIEKQIETAYQREVRLPSGGSIVIDQTEALVSIDINSSKATKGADVSETAFNTNLEAADEIARQLRLRDMGGLIVIDFIDMATDEHQKQVEARLKDATKNDRARLQFAEISRFGLLEMSRQRLRPSLEEATGFLCPRCHGTGMIRDLRSLALSIMRQIEQKALQERQGEIQAEVPTDIAAFLLNEKRDSLVYLEQESGTRITILPHAHMESPDFAITYNREGFAPSSYERVSESQQQENKDRGYDTSDWHTDDANEKPRVLRNGTAASAWSAADTANVSNKGNKNAQNNQQTAQKASAPVAQPVAQKAQPAPAQTSAVAWLSNLFAPTQQAQVAHSVSSQDAAAAIESIVNTGAKSLGIQGQLAYPTAVTTAPVAETSNESSATPTNNNKDNDKDDERRGKRPSRKPKNKKSSRYDADNVSTEATENNQCSDNKAESETDALPRREPNSRREPRGEKQRQAALTIDTVDNHTNVVAQTAEPTAVPERQNNKGDENKRQKSERQPRQGRSDHDKAKANKPADPSQLQMQVHKVDSQAPTADTTIHLSLDDSKPSRANHPSTVAKTAENEAAAMPVVTATTEPSAGVANAQAPVEQVAAVTETAVVETTESQPVEASAQPSVSLNVVPTQGRAKNDPREVYRAYRERLQGTPSIAPIAAPASKITGTVKQFIVAQLGADATDNGDSVVTSFIKAVAHFNQAFSQPTVQAPSTDSLPEFDQFFKNYGYQHLTAQNLQAYHQMITPANQFQVDAGKTQAEPAPVTQRASNDPRGQVVAVEVEATSADAKPVASTDATVNPVDSTIADNTATDNTIVDTVPSEIAHAASYATGSVGAWIVSRLGAQGQQMIDAGQLVNAYLLAHATNVSTDATVDVETTTADSQLAATTEAAIPEDVVAVGFIEVPHSADMTIDAISVDADEMADDGQNKSKTTPASYKNMIESVAEQLKPSVGSVLNLPTPKAPKARTRKAKTTDKPVAKSKTRTSKKIENAVIVKKSATSASTETVTPDSSVDNSTDSQD